MSSAGMEYQQHTLRFLTRSPDTTSFWEQRESQVESNLFIYIYICTYKYICTYTHTEWQFSFHQHFSGLRCIHWLEERFKLAGSFHLDTKQDVLWTLVLLIQRSASWNWRCLLEPHLGYLETWICLRVVTAEVSTLLLYEVLNISSPCTLSFTLEMVFLR